MKCCTRCKQRKPLSDFPVHSVDGKKYLTSWCRNCIRLSQKEKYHSNREHHLALKKAWQDKNREKVKEIRRKTNWRMKVATLTHYGGICKCCGEENPKFLTIDHINNDGYRTRAQSGRSGVASFYYWIKKNGYPTDLQVLCFNCNMAKALFKVCPHKA